MNNDVDVKLTKREVLKTSSLSSFPIFLYCLLSFVIIEKLSPVLQKFFEKKGFVFSENFGVFILYIFIYLLIFPLLILVFTLIAKKEKRVRISDCFKLPQKSFLWILKWFVIAFSVITISSGVGGYLLFIFSLLTGLDLSGINMFFATSSLVTVPNFAVDYLPTLVFAPILEEMLFRGLIFKNDEKLGFVFASITSSLLFGMWHMTLSQLILGFALGFFSCFLYSKTKSIFPSMLLHFLHNLRSVIGTYLMKRAGISNVSDYVKINDDLLLEHITDILLLFLFILVIGVLTIIGLTLLVITIVNRKSVRRVEPKFKNDMEVYESDVKTSRIIEESEVKEEKISGFKKVLLYYCSPVTAIAYALLIIGQVFRVI